MENHKIENKDVLESFWVDLCSEPIILYDLVEKYYPKILFMLVRVKFIPVAMLLLLLWNFYVRLFMRCICFDQGFKFIGVCMAELMIELIYCLVNNL